MHTLTRRALNDDWDLEQLICELDSGVAPLSDQDMLTAFNKFKATGGEQWAEIKRHCTDFVREERSLREEECGTCGQEFFYGAPPPGHGCRECMPSDSDSD